MKNISKNLVQLRGHIGKDIQCVRFDNGSAKATFSLAVNESYIGQDGTAKKNTTWFNIIGWGKTADTMVSELKKGMEVGLQGKLSIRRYTDKDGQNKSITEIVVFEVIHSENLKPETAD